MKALTNHLYSVIAGLSLVIVTAVVGVLLLFPGDGDGGDGDDGSPYGRCVYPSAYNSTVIDVSQYGIVGDGVTDVTSSLQTILDDVAGTGATVYIPGMY